MLVPKKDLIIEEIDGQNYCHYKYLVYDDKKKEFITNRVFKNYDTQEECQKMIDYFNSFSIYKVS